MIALPRDLANRLIDICLKALPRQAYGMVGGVDLNRPGSVYPCSTNLRNMPEWNKLFESFGESYEDPDRGFVITPEEYRETLKKMEDRGETFIGVYHTHRWKQPTPSEADLALHVDPGVFCCIVSVTDPARPEIKIYRIDNARYEEIPFRIT